MIAVEAKAASAMRLHALDVLRGVAVVSMLVDHVCAVLAARWSLDARVLDVLYVLRMTVGRVAFPLFMLTSGVLLSHRRPSLRSWSTVAVLGVCFTVIIWAARLPLGTPDILLLWSLCMLCWPIVTRWPVLVASVGIVQATAWDLPWSVWRNYQPGLLLAFFAVGFLGGVGRVRADWSVRLPARVVEGVAAIGRRSLVWYCAHVLVLLVVTL